MTQTIGLSIWFLSLLVVSTAQAEIYKWVDDDGTIHFSDYQPRQGPVETVDLKINTYSSPKLTSSKRDTGSDKTVVMYSADWCGVCKEAKAYFQKNNIPFKDYDVENSAKARREFRSMGGKGVPIILVGKRRMNGFSAANFRRMYDK